MANDPEEGVKFIVKTRLSHIHREVDKRTLYETANSLGRLLADLNPYLNGLPENNE